MRCVSGTDMNLWIALLMMRIEFLFVFALGLGEGDEG